jgi:hypothetical protein
MDGCSTPNVCLWIGMFDSGEGVYRYNDALRSGNECAATLSGTLVH